MKKALFFMIFIFATAICGYAQETTVAEQNDDKTLDSRHQNRRTMADIRHSMMWSMVLTSTMRKKTGKEVIFPAIRTAIIL